MCLITCESVAPSKPVDSKALIGFSRVGAFNSYNFDK